MARPPQPLTEEQKTDKVMNTHEVVFTEKVAPWNAEENAWFPYRVAVGYCMNGVAVPRRYKDGEGEIQRGHWSLNSGQIARAQQLAAARGQGGGDFARQLEQEKKDRELETARVNEADLQAAEAAGDPEGGFSEAAKKGTGTKAAKASTKNAGSGEASASAPK